MTTYSVSFSNRVYAFNNWVMVWMRSLFTPKSLKRISFFAASFSALSPSPSILAISVPMSGRQKILYLEHFLERYSTLFSVNSTGIVFFVDNKVQLCINHMHFTIVILHVKVFRFLEELLYALFT